MSRFTVWCGISTNIVRIIHYCGSFRGEYTLLYEPYNCIVRLVRILYECMNTEHGSVQYCTIDTI
jgi:hypothetical protein